MKRNVLFYVLLLLVVFSNGVYAQKYHEDDKEGLRQFLRQEGYSPEGKKIYNFEVAGLTVADTLSWNTSEEWLNKISRYISQDPWSGNRISRIKLSDDIILSSNLYFNKFSGNLNCDKFTGLVVLYFPENKINNLKVDKNVNLVILDCQNNQLTSLDVSNNSYLSDLYCSNNQIAEINVTNNPNLVNFYCSHNKLKTLDLTNNPELITLQCSHNEIETLFVKRNLKLKQLYCGNNKLLSLDLKECTTLFELYLSGNENLSELNVTECPRLISLSAGHTKLTTLDVSKNHELESLGVGGLLESIDLNNNPKLSSLMVSSNKISYLDLNNLPELSSLMCSNNQLTSLDVKNNPKLRNLTCFNNKLTSLDLSNNLDLYNLSCYNNELSNLNLINHVHLSFFYCQENKLKFSTLKYNTSKLQYWQISPQALIEGGTVGCFEEIDISSEYNINGTLTTYEWYDDLENAVSVTNLGNGKFTAGEANKGKTLICKMTNALFPDLTLEYEVKISETGGTPPPAVASSLSDHLKLNSGSPNLYQLTAGTTFKVLAKATNNQQNLKIGLFDNYNNLVARVDLSQNQNQVFSCQIPSNVSAGNYILQAYTEKDNKVILTERPANSYLLDAILVNVKAEDIWSRGLASATDNEIYKNMQIKTAVNYLHQTETNESFKIYSPTTNGEVKIGLFDLKGNFIERIDRSKANATTYNVMVSDRVYEGEYLIIPYIESGNQKQIVERDASTKIDRLPLYVNEEDIWGRSISSKSVTQENEIEVALYPNPVTDILKITSQSNVQEIKIYDYTGKEIRSFTSVQNNQVNLQDLPSGNYILTAIIDKETVTKKIIKR